MRFQLHAYRQLLAYESFVDFSLIRGLRKVR